MGDDNEIVSADEANRDRAEARSLAELQRENRELRKQALERENAALREQNNPARGGAAAPYAPSTSLNELPTNGGLVNLFACTEQQIHDLRPSGVRREHEKWLEIGREQSGGPARPIPGGGSRR
jgi:hypothetical protein